MNAADQRPKWSHGRPVNLNAPPTVVEVDCSTWDADVPTELWSHGRPVPVFQKSELIEVDCSAWGQEPTSWLEFTVAFEADADLKAVEEATADYVRAIGALEPELGLTYDQGRTRVNADGDLVVALVPQRPDANRLKAVRDKVAKVLKVKQLDLVGV